MFGGDLYMLFLFKAAFREIENRLSSQIDRDKLDPQ